MRLTVHRYMRQALAATALLVGGLSLTSCGPAQAGKGNAEAKAALAQADKLSQKQNWRQARKSVDAAIEADPNWPDAHIRHAHYSLQMFDGQSALKSLEKAEDLGYPPDDTTHMMAEALWLTGKLDEAEELLVSSVIPKQHYATAQFILARVYIDQGRLGDAATHLNTALTTYPHDRRLWTELARLRQLFGDGGGAIQAIDRAIKEGPNDVRALVLRGRIARNQYGMAAGLPWFQRALQLALDDIQALEEYGITLGDMGAYREMLKITRQINALDGRNGRAYYMQAVIAARAGDCLLSQRILDMAGSAINASPGAMLVRGVCDYRTGNYESAVGVFERLLSAQPNNVTVRRLLALTLYRSGDMQGALEHIQPLAPRADAGSYSLMIIGRVLEGLDRPQDASEAFDAAAQPVFRQMRVLDDGLSDISAADGARRNPKNAYYVIPYIRSLMRQGNLNAALNSAQQLRSANPGVANAHMIEGDVEVERGNMPAAVNAYRRTAQISFTDPVMLRLSDAYKRQGNAKAQRQMIDNYVRNNPTSLSALRVFADLRIGEGKYKEAIPALEYVLSRTGFNDSILLANLARCYAGGGDIKKALHFAGNAYYINPSNPIVTYIYGKILLDSGTRPKAARELLQKAKLLAPDNKQIDAAFMASQKGQKDTSSTGGKARS